jgi:hypothetical protein
VASSEGVTIALRPATFVELTADQERCAIGALAELLVPLLTEPQRGIPDRARVAPVTAIGDTCLRSTLDRCQQSEGGVGSPKER